MNTLIADVKNTFTLHYGYPATHIIQAPGVVNLIGEYSDYSQGRVLSCALNYQVMVAAARRSDNIVRVMSLAHGKQEDQFTLSKEIEYHCEWSWAKAIRGMAKALLERGYQFQGADIVLSGNIPQGVLLSSAPLQVVIGQSLKTLYALNISQVDIALAAQQAENEVVAANTSIMDPFISACAEKDHALLLDGRSLNTQSIAIPENIAIMIIKPDLVSSEYPSRRLQCAAVAKVLSVPTLHDVSIEQLNNHLNELHPELAKRARHVISENARAVQAADALRRADMKLMGQLMAESHISMRDDFAITAPEIDLLVDMVKAEIGEQGGVRMAGGCVVALLPRDLVKQVKSAIVRQYKAATGLQESIYLCRAEDGARHIITIRN